MNWKRIGRFLVCLVLVCCILINCSPIRAEATGVEALYLSTVFVNPTIAVTAVLFGLGVMVTAAATAVFTKLVDEVTADMVDKGLISSNGVDMYRSDADGAATYLVNQELVEAVREYLFEKEVVSVTATEEGFKSYNGYIYPDYSHFKPSGTFVYPCCIFESSLHGTCFLFVDSRSPSPQFASSVGKWSDCYYLWVCYWLFKLDGSSWVQIDEGVATGGGGFPVQGSNVSTGETRHVIWTKYVDIAGVEPSAEQEATVPIVGVFDGLTAGEIAPQEKTFAEGYSAWASGAKSLPTLRDGVQTDAMSAYIALGMGMTQEETMAMTQAAVQSGVGTYENTGTATDAVTATGLKGWLDTIRLTLVSGFSDLIDGIKSIPSSIVSGLTSVLEAIFVPSEDFLTEKVQVLRSEFAFADTLITGGQMIGDAFSGFDTEPPIIYIDLGATEGDYDIGGKVPFIDLTWYEEYKPTVDMLLSSFLWIVFIWKLFQKAPGIISGMPGDFVMEGLQQIGMDTYLPYRKESHEKVRRLNRRSKL